MRMRDRGLVAAAATVVVALAFPAPGIATRSSAAVPPVLTSPMTTPAEADGTVTVPSLRDHVLVDLLVQNPVSGCGDWQSVTAKGPSRVTRLDVTTLGRVVSSAKLLPLDYCGFNRIVAAHGAGLLIVAPAASTLSNWSTDGRRVLRSWFNPNVILDADSATRSRALAVLVQGSTVVTLVRGSLDSSRWRAVRSWPVNLGVGALALAPDGISAYVAVVSRSGTTLVRVNIRTGAQTTIRRLPGLEVAALDLSPNGRYLVAAYRWWHSGINRVVQPVSMIPASGGRGAFTLHVPGAATLGLPGRGPDSIAFSADGLRLYMGYGWTPPTQDVGVVFGPWSSGAVMQVRVCANCGNAKIVLGKAVEANGLAVLRP